MEALIGAGASIIVGVLSLVGVVITNNNSNRGVYRNILGYLVKSSLNKLWDLKCLTELMCQI